MKRRLFITIGAVFICWICYCQDTHIKDIDSLNHELTDSKNDTIKFIMLGKIANIYSEINPDSAFFYAEQMLPITQKLHYKLEESLGLAEMGYAQLNLGNYPRSLQYFLSAMAITTDPESEKKVLPKNYPVVDEFTDRSKSPYLQRLDKLSRIYQFAGILYGNSGNYKKSFYYYFAALHIAEETSNLRTQSITYSTIGRTYLSLKKTDSALDALQKAYGTAIKSNYYRYIGSVLLNIGRVYAAMGQLNTAIAYYRRAITESLKHEYFRGVVATDLALADVFSQTGNPDSALFYIRTGLPVANYLNAPDIFLRCYTALADYYIANHKNDSAVKYQTLIIRIDKSLFSVKQAQQFQNIDIDEMQRQQQIESAKTAYRNKTTQYALLAGLSVFLLVAFILYRNNRQKQKTNKVLQKTLRELKSTQAQLIQSEKMASLGELTAGIAHEIQNPLNFVNNFSEVNKELLEELKAERLKPNDKRNDDLQDDLINDVIDNEEKINHHGKRADAIVKGMLQHSRSSTGQKEPVSLNGIAEECLRLSYQALRAKDKSFQANLKTDFDKSIDKIFLVQQDIVRALVNLFNNAFYEVNEKSKQQIQGYEPTVSVSTKKINDKVILTVMDNGNGIPQKVIDKIFQPFFTTKPTGQGTGLGLSLSYDIVKAHGGEIKVNTMEGGFTEFNIILPV